MVTLEEVLLQSESLDAVLGLDIKSFFYITALFFFTLLVYFIYLNYFSSYKDYLKNDESNLFVNLILFVVIIVVSSSFIYLYYYNSILNSRTSEWENNYLFPYIESLELSTSNIDTVDVDLSFDEKAKDYEHVYYTDKSLYDSTSSVYVVYDNGKTLKSNVVVKYDLDKDAEPYMTYKYLNVDSASDSANLSSGFYDLIIHLNKK